MSYDNYKRKIFLKNEEGYLLPMILLSNSSLREETGRMVEYWTYSNFGLEEDIYPVTQVKYEINIKKRFKEIQEEFQLTPGDDEYYGTRINGKQISNEEFEKYFLNGSKRAVLLEDFLNFNQMDFLSYQLMFTDTNKEETTTSYFHFKKNEDIQRFRDYLLDNQKNGFRLEGIFISTDLQQKKRPKKNAKWRNSYYVLKHTLIEEYVYKLQKRKIGFTDQPEIALKFATEEEAEKQIQKYQLGLMKAEKVMKKVFL